MYKTCVNNEGVYASAKKKTAIAKVKLYFNNELAFIINGKPLDKQSNDLLFKYIINSVFEVIRYYRFAVVVNVHGGGVTAQAYAIRLAVVKCILRLNINTKSVLKEHGYISTDCRIVERKKYGLSKARKSYQFSKR